MSFAKRCMAKLHFKFDTSKLLIMAYYLQKDARL